MSDRPGLRIASALWRIKAMDTGQAFPATHGFVPAIFVRYSEADYAAEYGIIEEAVAEIVEKRARV